MGLVWRWVGNWVRLYGYRGGSRVRDGEGRSSKVGAVPTFSTNADFKHPGAEAVSSWHTEAGVGGVVFRTHEDVTGGREAVRLDAFHLHVLHIGQMNGPEGERDTGSGVTLGNHY